VNFKEDTDVPLLEAKMTTEIVSWMKSESEFGERRQIGAKVNEQRTSTEVNLTANYKAIYSW
jgi:hypothetical protein